MNGATINIIDTLDDPGLFEPWFRGESWNGWRAVLKGAFGLPMTTAEIEFFRTVDEREPPRKRVRELWIVAGRRAGKDSIASLIAAHASAMFDRQHLLRPGERALVACIAYDKDQGRTVLDYCRGYFNEAPLLAQMVHEDTRVADFRLTNSVYGGTRIAKTRTKKSIGRWYPASLRSTGCLLESARLTGAPDCSIPSSKDTSVRPTTMFLSSGRRHDCSTQPYRKALLTPRWWRIRPPLGLNGWQSFAMTSPVGSRPR
jgi:hypothetical protein